MSGALLRSGSIRDYHALGAVGNPVFSAATQLRAAMRRQIGADISDLFAIPKQSEDGTTIDWYAPTEGDVVPWSSATPEEQSAAREALQSARDHLADKSASLQAENDSERQIFGKLLAQAIAVPSEAHLYLVGGKPVMTFWGFTERGAPAGSDVVGSLCQSAAGTLATKNTATENRPSEKPRRDLPWWLWLLLLLLLLLLALWLLRSCTEETSLSSEEPQQAGEKPENESRSSVELLPSETVRVTPGTGVVLGETAGAIGEPSVETDAVGSALDAASQQTEGVRDAEDSNTPESSGSELPTAEEPGTDEETSTSDETSADARPEDAPTEPPSETPPDDGAGEPSSETESSPPGAPDDAPLTIPQSAVETGSTGFLNGKWKSETGLQDADTGQPLSLDYDMQDGAGTVTLSHGAGASRQTCEGAAASSMENEKLTIEHGAITCPDGSRFERSRVECAVGDGGRANCRGINEDQSTYDVQIGR